MRSTISENLTIQINISDNRRIFEIGVVIATGIGKFIFMDLLELRLTYIIIACLFWMSYIFYRSKQNKGILKYWGLSSRYFTASFLGILPFALVLIGLFVIVGIQRDTNILDWSIIPILLLYPLWGIIQQFVIVGLIARNLKDLKKIKVPYLFIILFTALIFSIVHYPSALLMAGTFLLAIAYTKLYLSGRNLIVLGIYHGWLGAFFYYTILERNSWQEVFVHLDFQKE